MHLLCDDAAPFLPLAHVLAILGLHRHVVRNGSKNVKIWDNRSFNFRPCVSPIYVDPVSLPHLLQLLFVVWRIAINDSLNLRATIRSNLIVFKQCIKH